MPMIGLVSSQQRRLSLEAS
ncbi:a4084ff5-39ad-468b-8c4a-95d1c198c169 [Thermothielavioides terrestris]|uniref:A4084ff5-39ad-468b-8c4a-95d1c198c169 n=1 Tax=Thermothielavioides terrestris TaxID=2587410 RepID=A0A3S4BJG0_9PEZI|nr:a4084ff5-39ad-468b-8c4a-95d1c198c169 [Thermothielavioides terrestris]